MESVACETGREAPHATGLERETALSPGTNSSRDELIQKREELTGPKY